jgi:P4 family phage/plasmid primase-like protien
MNPTTDQNQTPSVHKISPNDHPGIWFQSRFPEVFKRHGQAVEMTVKEKVNCVRDLNDDFLAETLGFLGNPKAPTVYVTREDRFYQYDNQQGIFVSKSENQIIAEISTLLHQCAEDCHRAGICDTSSLRFQLSKAGKLAGVIKKAKGFLHVDEGFFESELEDYIACRNGMLCLSDNTLRPFSPDYRRRNKLAVDFDPNAKCPLFLDKLMQQALDGDDIAFLQKWFGLALLGKNLSHKIVILSGTARGGKSTFVNVVIGVIGKENVNSLRTERLGERFETSFYLGKTLLSGADVPGDFLTQKSASALKALTGGDTMTAEQKNGREQLEIIGNYNVIITSNSRLNIRLEGDTEAWKGRLVIVEYRKAKPQQIITSLSDIILKDEGSGVLNWALEGLKQLRIDNWLFKLTERQLSAIDKTLLESDSPQVFAKECLENVEGSQLTQEDCFGYYVEFCKKRDWQPIPRIKFSSIIENQIMKLFAIGLRKDIIGANGKDQRGFKDISIKAEAGLKKLSESPGGVGQSGRVLGPSNLPEQNSINTIGVKETCPACPAVSEPVACGAGQPPASQPVASNLI